MIERISSNNIAGSRTVNPKNQNTGNQVRQNNKNNEMKSGGVILQLGSPSAKPVTYERPISKAVMRPEAPARKKSENTEMVNLEMKKNLLDILMKQTFTDKNETSLSAEPNKGSRSNISKDGEFSSDSVSQRIFDFAMSISGGDPEAMMMLRDVIVEGFEEVKKMLGGQLPQVSHETMEKTMKKFDDFFKEI